VSDPQGPAAIGFDGYRRTVQQFDRDALVQMAGWASSHHLGVLSQDGSPSRYLPWNVAGLAITAVCFGKSGGPAPTEAKFRELCWYFSNIVDEEVNLPNAGLNLMTRLFHQQLPFQLDLLNEMSRLVALFDQTPLPENYRAEAMTGEWFEQLTGGSAAEFSAVSFVLWASAVSSNGIYRDECWDSSMDPFLELLPISRIREIASRNFVATIEELKQQQADVQARVGGPLQFGYNPLVGRPFISDVVPNGWIAPSAHLVAQKASATGLVHAGVSRWGEAFTRDLGHLFQAYVGRNLALVDGTLIAEFEYGTTRRPQRSTDWMLILDDFVLLFEVKAAIASESVRQGQSNLFESDRSRLGKGIRQVERTAAEIRAGNSRFAEIPMDRDIVAFIVTLGEFPDAAMMIQESGSIGHPSHAVGVLSSGDLEHLVALPNDQFRGALQTALARHTRDNVIDTGSMMRGLPRVHNAVVESAWFGNPLIDYLRPKGDGQVVSGEANPD